MAAMLTMATDTYFTGQKEASLQLPVMMMMEVKQLPEHRYCLHTSVVKEMNKK